MVKKQRKSRRGLWYDRKGITLMEMLAVVVIVVLFTAMVVTGTQLSLRSYSAVTDESNAEVLLSTTVTLLRTEFTTATDISVSDNKVSYSKGSSGMSSVIRSGSGDTASDTNAQIYITQAGKERPLVQNITATNGLCVRYDSAKLLANGKVQIDKLEVYKASSGKVLSSLDSVIL